MLLWPRKGTRALREQLGGPWIWFGRRTQQLSLLGTKAGQTCLGASCTASCLV